MTQRVEPRSTDPSLEKQGVILKVNDLRISFVTRAGVVQAINGVSFEIWKGETFGLVGETGCGKSQTALAIMRLTSPSGIIEKGEIMFNGNDLAQDASDEYKLTKKGKSTKLKLRKSKIKKTQSEMARIRGKDITMIFQEPMTSLNPVYTIGRQVSEVLLTHSLDELAERILARNKSDPSVLANVAVDAIREGFSRSQLSNRLEELELSGLEDQIWFNLNRKDIGDSQKKKIIEDLAKRKISGSFANYLEQLKKNSGRFTLSQGILNRIPFINRSYIGLLRKEAIEASYELLTLVRMPNASSVLNQYPHELSGGMRQRVMIAMAIAAKPKLIIADEPTSALDVTVQAQILDLLMELKSNFNTSILFISHDMGIIAEICNRVGVMYAGNIVETATIDEIFSSPKHPYTRGLLATIPKYEKRKQDLLQTIRGNVPNLINPPKGCRFNSRCPEVFEKCTQGPPWIKISEEQSVLCWLYGDSEKHVDQ